MTAPPDPGPMPPSSKGDSTPRRPVLLAAVAVVTALAVVGIGVAIAASGGTDATGRPPGPAVTVTPGTPSSQAQSTGAAPTVASPSAVATALGSSTAAGPLTETTAIAAAEAVYREYLRIDNEVGHAGYRDSQPYAAVLVDPALANLRRATQLRTGQRQLGDAKVKTWQVISVSLREGVGYYPRVVLQVCVDVTNVRGLSATGSPLPTNKRSDALPAQAVVQRYAPRTPGVPVAGGWFIAEVAATGPSC